MTRKISRRGFDPEDTKCFSVKEMEKLRIAREEVQWLMDRGYKIKPVMGLVGDRYLLSARQRTAIQRATSSEKDYLDRAATMITSEAAHEGYLLIDGFNLIITLEVALSGSLLILGVDGVLRDLAGLRGTYSLIDKTDTAMDLIGKTLNDLSVPGVKFYLDAPVSNSGKLKKKILESADGWQIPTDVELVHNPDTVLSASERVVTGDSEILDKCTSWLNLSRIIVEKYIKDAWVVRF
jgi:hypothetical protein